MSSVSYGMAVFYFFFFKQKTAYEITEGDWSSDVCSSDLLAASYEYDAWGNYLATSGTSGNELGYTGQHADAESGLMPLGNGERYYAPGLGSFTQQDSLTGQLDVPASLNRYSYAHDNPVIHTDPSGHLLPFLILA